MYSLSNSGWMMTGMSSQAATVDVGIAAGGGRFSINIRDSRGTTRTLNYLGLSVGAGIGVHSDGIGRAGAALMNYFLPMLRGAFNSLDLPSRQSRMFLVEGFARAAPLDWSDFEGHFITIHAIGAGMGVGAGGCLINFNESFDPALVPFLNARAVAFNAGMQLAQVGADAIVTQARSY